MPAFICFLIIACLVTSPWYVLALFVFGGLAMMCTSGPAYDPCAHLYDRGKERIEQEHKLICECLSCPLQLKWMIYDMHPYICGRWRALLVYQNDGCESGWYIPFTDEPVFYRDKEDNFWINFKGDHRMLYDADSEK